MLYGIYDANFFSSADSGKTWKIKPIDANKLFKSITFLDQQTGVAVGNFLTTYRTTNGGTTWTKYVHGGAEGFNKIYSKTKDECYITGNTGRLFHTTDGGVSWTFRELNNGALQNVVFPTPDTGYVSASGVIFRTIDAGNNWTKFTQTNNGGFLSFPNKDTGYVGFSSGWIDRTVDAGQTWNPAVDYTYITNNGGNIGAYFRSTSEGLVSSNNLLLYTNDGGITWQTKATGIGATSILPIKDNWLVLNTGNVYLCDKDINCTLKYTDKNYNLTLLFKPDSNTIVIPTNNDSILKSKDFGNTWIKEYFPSMGQLAFENRNTIYSLIGMKIYRGTIKSLTTSSQFTKIDNQTLSCTITNDANENYNASILLITSTLDTIALSTNTVIINGIPISIKIPNTIQANTYTILIQPTDTAAFSVVQSQSFTRTGVSIVETEKPLIIKVVGNRIVCDDCLNLEIYNTLGQRMQNNSELPIGIYIVKCNNKTQKVIIKP